MLFAALFKEHIDLVQHQLELAVGQVDRLQEAGTMRALATRIHLEKNGILMLTLKFHKYFRN